MLCCLVLCPSSFPGQAAALADDVKRASAKLNNEARRAMRKGEYTAAIDIYKSILDKNGQDLQARLGISWAYVKDQDYSLCLDHASEALKIDPANARGHALAGLALLRSGHIRESVGLLQQAINLNPREALAYGAAAEIDYYEGRVKEARERALYAHKLDPQEPDFVMTYARASSRAEDYKEAADAYEIFLDIAPEADTERLDRIRGLIRFYRKLSGMPVHQLTGSSRTQVPFRLGSDRRPYINVKVNGRDAVFVIDTGSGFTVVSRHAAKRLGVSEIARGGKSQGVGGDGKFPIIYGLIKMMHLGEARVRMIPCFIREFHGVNDRPPEEQPDGFIGLSVLSHYITELDYKNNIMRLDREGDGALLADLPDATVVPFRMTQNGLISIETEFDERHRVNAILDSGASSTVVSAAAVERLKLHDQIIKGQTISVIGAAGITSNVNLIYIRNCRVANLKQNNLRALVLDFNAINETSGFEQSGILGGDFLRHFRLTIDFNRTRLVFQPHSNAVEKQ
jgi:tetratricopeptide (TPR) repeat protein